MTDRAEAPQTPWHEFRTRLRRFVSSRINEPADAEDVVQLVLERAVRNDSGGDDSATRWLYAVARNAITDYYRAKARGPMLVEVEEPPVPTDPDSGRQLLADCMQPLLDALDADSREVLTWADMEDQSMQSIADRLGVPLSTAKSRVQRSRRKLLGVIESCCELSVDVTGRVTDCEMRPGTKIQCPSSRRDSD